MFGVAVGVKSNMKSNVKSNMKSNVKPDVKREREELCLGGVAVGVPSVGRRLLVCEVSRRCPEFCCCAKKLWQSGGCPRRCVSVVFLLSSGRPVGEGA